MQRRTLLKLGIVSGAALALVGGGAALFYERVWRNGQLTHTGRLVFGAIGRAVLDGSLPAAEDALTIALASHLDRMEVTLRAMAPATQREVCEMLSILAMPPGRLALAGLAADWSSATVLQIQTALQTMRISRLALRQQIYHALRDLTHAAYFADRATWAQLGYPGPTMVE